MNNEVSRLVENEPDKIYCKICRKKLNRENWFNHTLTKTHQKKTQNTICYHSPSFQISSDIKEHICWHRDQQKLFTSFNNGLTIYVCSV